MVKNGGAALVPDAWEDDDWESAADKIDAQPTEVQPELQVPMTKAERLAQHAEQNRKLWESAYVFHPEVFSCRVFMALFITYPMSSQWRWSSKTGKEANMNVDLL